MGEFELIRKVFEPVSRAQQCDDLMLGPGDDCAIQRVSPGCDLVFSVDTLVEGVHFPRQYAPELLAYRALGVAVSDLAAMGADPVCYTLALTLPRADEHWLQSFGLALAEASCELGIALAGGDTTRGPLTLSLQVHGTVPAGKALRRQGAHPGDLVVVSGALGDAAAALDWLNSENDSASVSVLLERYHRPRPRLALGQCLRGCASAAIDVSDGLLADLAHILSASGVGATVDARKIPLSRALQRVSGERSLELALGGGDDYELCFTVPGDRWTALQSASPVSLTVIGEITNGAGIELRHADTSGRRGVAGYDHFGESDD